MADIPNAPGVPFLDSYAATAALDFLVADAIEGFGAGPAPLWGVYLNGFPIIIADTVTGFGWKNDWAIANYPIEGGGFASYDKVSTPFLAKVQFAAGGSVDNKRDLIRSLDIATSTLTKYDVVTPEVIYQNVNISHIDYDRKAAAGVGLLVIDVWLQEIREQKTSGQDVKVPSGAAQQSDGSVQPSSPFPADDTFGPTDVGPKEIV